MKNKTFDYTPAKIYDANGDITKKWYVYYSYRNPITNRKERQRIFQDINKFATKRDRMKVAKTYQIAMNNLLAEGFNPYENPLEVTTAPETIIYALREVLAQKKKSVRARSVEGYEHKTNRLIRWIKTSGLDYLKPDEINKVTLTRFLNEQMEVQGWRPSSYNSWLRELRVLFEVMLENEWIVKNPLAKLKYMKSTPEKHRTYSHEQVNQIMVAIEKKDKQLALVVKIVSYLFLRPVEVMRLRVGDIDLNQRILRVDTKKEKGRVRIIPEILLPEFERMELDRLPPDFMLISLDGKPGRWDVIEQQRRQVFSKRFSRIRNSLGIDTDFTLYSFRHTFITDLYNQMRNKGLSGFEVKSKLMVITGHASMQSLEKYLRTIPVELPQDYSQEFGIKL